MAAARGGAFAAGGHSTSQAAGFAILVAAVLAVLACLWARSRRSRRPPFSWVVMAEEYDEEFRITGKFGEVVEKCQNYGEHGWVIPINGTLSMLAGKVYRWALVIDAKCQERPQIQFGIQGREFLFPWRLVTTSRCSRSRDDDEEWQERPNGDRLIEERDVIHLELDLSSTPGRFLMAVNDEPFELLFSDIPTEVPIMPVVMLGGHGSRMRVAPEAETRRR